MSAASNSWLVQLCSEGERVRGGEGERGSLLYESKSNLCVPRLLAVIFGRQLHFASSPTSGHIFYESQIS